MMKQIAGTVVFTMALMISSIALAGIQTATLYLPGINCPSCPYMIRSAISEVDGVKDVTVAFERRTATVVFDDTITTVEAIQKATASIGFPSSVLELDDSS
jgi:mercuric ion binding protein